MPAGATSDGVPASGTVTAITEVNAVKTIDALVSEINNDTDLKTKIRASNDNGKLRLENLSTQTLNIAGVTSSGIIDGTSFGAATIVGNSVRADLAEQFNELRDQLDKLSDDASFNGINLLRGDNLKITFNETGTSTITIQTPITLCVDWLPARIPMIFPFSRAARISCGKRFRDAIVTSPIVFQSLNLIHTGRDMVTS